MGRSSYTWSGRRAARCAVSKGQAETPALLDFAAPLGFSDGVGNTLVASICDPRSPGPSVFFILIVLIRLIQVVGVRILFIEIRQWITNVFEYDFRRDVAKFKVMHGDRLDEARKRDGLKFGVNEVTDAFGQSVAIWASGQRFPVKIYGHTCSCPNR